VDVVERLEKEKVEEIPRYHSQDDLPFPHIQAITKKAPSTFIYEMRGH
jgi:hypothetical protein